MALTLETYIPELDTQLSRVELEAAHACYLKWCRLGDIAKASMTPIIYREHAYGHLLFDVEYNVYLNSHSDVVDLRSFFN